MLIKPIRLTFSAGQAAVLKVIIEQLITQPQSLQDHTTLARMVVADWYRRHAGKFVLIPETLKLTFTAPQAYALNMLLLQHGFTCETTKLLASGIIGLIDPKI